MISPFPARVLRGLVLLLPSYAFCAAQSESNVAAPPEIPEKVMAAHLLSSPGAKLPEGFLKRCSNALVMLKITVFESGKIMDEEVTSGYDELKDPSLKAVRQWTYKPYEQNGRAIPVSSRVSLFYLGDGESFPMYSPDGKGGVKAATCFLYRQGVIPAQPSRESLRRPKAKRTRLAFLQMAGPPGAEFPKTGF